MGRIVEEDEDLARSQDLTDFIENEKIIKKELRARKATPRCPNGRRTPNLLELVSTYQNTYSQMLKLGTFFVVIFVEKCSLFWHSRQSTCLRPSTCDLIMVTRDFLKEFSTTKQEKLGHKKFWFIKYQNKTREN